jgi:hypothetical protein
VASVSEILVNGVANAVRRWQLFTDSRCVGM